MLEERIEINDLSIDIPGHEVIIGNKKLELTLRQFDLLTFMARNRGRVITRPKILLEVWGETNGTTLRAVDTEMCRLRKKLETVSISPNRLISIRGMGYKFVQ